MKIYNEEKTQELNYEELNLELGYLKSDKLLIAHHNAVEAREAVYEDRIVKEANGGVSVYKEIVSPAVEAKEAWDEFDVIQVYVPYTKKELEEHRLNTLRLRREPLLNAFDKWEKAVLRGREEDKEFIMDWYYDLLDLKEYAFEKIPEQIKYYMQEKLKNRST